MNCGYWLVSLGLCCVELDVFVSEAGYKFNEEKLLEYNHMSFVFFTEYGFIIIG